MEKVLGYHRQLNADAYQTPKGLTGAPERYRFTRNGQEKEIVMAPVGRNIYHVPMQLGWNKNPVLVVHKDGNRWQVDDAVSGLAIVVGHESRQDAIAAVRTELQRAGEERFWKAHQEACRALRSAKAPLNKVEIVK